MYDVKCLELAKAFIEDHPHLQGREGELAQHIQTSIEEWIETPPPAPSTDPFNLRQLFENFV